MTLNLTPEDAARYEELVRKAEADKQAAIARGDHRAARKARQWISHLYSEYCAKQVSPDVCDLPSRRQREYEELTLEQRVARIERVLGLTRFD